MTSRGVRYRLDMSDPVCTLDPNVYTIEGVQRIGSNLVLKVRYPGCDGCAAEGVKILVFLNVTETEALDVEADLPVPPDHETQAALIKGDSSRR